MLRRDKCDTLKRFFEEEHIQVEEVHVHSENDFNCEGCRDIVKYHDGKWSDFINDFESFVVFYNAPFHRKFYYSHGTLRGHIDYLKSFKSRAENPIKAHVVILESENQYKEFVHLHC